MTPEEESAFHLKAVMDLERCIGVLEGSYGLDHTKTRPYVDGLKKVQEYHFDLYVHGKPCPCGKIGFEVNR